MASQRRILAIKLADLGDLLLCEPALRSLRLTYPSAEIDVLTKPGSAELVPLLGLDLGVFRFENRASSTPRTWSRFSGSAETVRLSHVLRSRSYDTVCLFHHLTTAAGARKFRLLLSAIGAPECVGLDNGRGGFLGRRVIDRGFGVRHEAALMLGVAEAAGGTAVDSRPRVEVRDESTNHFLPERYIAVYPATGPYAPAREWPVQYYRDLCRRLGAEGWPLVILGSPSERGYGREIAPAGDFVVDLTGKTDLPSLAAVVKRAALVVGGDSFIGHLASAVGTPVVAIFGPTNADAWRPYGTVDFPGSAEPSIAGYVISQRLPCSPCLYTGYRLGRRDGCPARTCLTTITAEHVLAAIDDLLGRAR
jgi:heptosyltransferase-2